MPIDSSPAEVFRSKRDNKITLFVWVTSVLLWIFSYGIISSNGPLSERLFGFSITFLTGFLGPWFWFATMYRVSTTSLYMQSGMLHKELMLKDILRVTYKEPSGHNFALSRDSLHLEVKGSDRGYRVSPIDRRGFLKVLDERCIHLKAEGENLVSSAG